MVSGYPTSTNIPKVDGLSTDTPVLGRHRGGGGGGGGGTNGGRKQYVHKARA